jgi:two-component system cell cycle sensor histidine kinase/response regulator CckA
MNAADHALPTRVLIVDDELSARTFAERVLRAAGYAVDTASSGAEAVRIVEREGTFALFVIDVMMPGIRGDALARQLRQRHPDAKVLYVTGYADFLLHEESVLGENEAVLSKPASAAELREAVSHLLFEHPRGLE